MSRVLLLRETKCILVLAVAGVLVYFVGQAKTDEIILDHEVHSVTQATPYSTRFRLRYDVNASEGLDPNDIAVMTYPGMDILGSSEMEGIRYYLVTKPFESTTETHLNFERMRDGIEGREHWRFTINHRNGALDSKNIFFTRYGVSEPNDPNNALDMWDVKDVNGTGWYESGAFGLQTADLYDRGVFEVFNVADLNRDQKIDLVDYAILAANWQRTDIDKGSHPTVQEDYADMDGSRIVDMNDLSAFALEWSRDVNNLQR